MVTSSACRNTSAMRTESGTISPIASEVAQVTQEEQDHQQREDAAQHDLLAQVGRARRSRTRACAATTVILMSGNSARSCSTASYMLAGDRHGVRARRPCRPRGPTAGCAVESGERCAGSATVQRDGGDVAEPDAAPAGPTGVSRISSGVLELGEAPERKPELAPADGAARRAGVGRREPRSAIVVGRDAQRARPLRVDLDPDLVLGLADHRDAGDPGELLQPPGVHVLGGARDRPEVALAR